MGNVVCCCCREWYDDLSHPVRRKTAPEIKHTDNVDLGRKDRASVVSTASSAFPTTTKTIVTCIHDFKDTKTGKKIRKGDSLEVYNNIDEEWLKVLNLSTQTIGCIPKNYTKETSTNDVQDWFFGQVNRKEAERILLNQDTLTNGLFLVRNFEHKADHYVLSFLDYEEDEGYSVVHFKISKSQDKFVIESKTFSNLDDLIRDYLRKDIITQPCPKPQPQLWDLDIDHKERWELSRNDIELGHALGEGRFGKVHLAYWKDTTKVAVKSLKNNSVSKNELLQEASVMKKFRHPGLLTLYGVCSDDEPFLLVLEYMKHGDLLTILRKDRGLRLQFLDLIDIAVQISSGMEHLASKDLIHRDLAARNILVGDSNTVKISDFGMARLLNEKTEEDKKGYFIPIKWAAPEIIEHFLFTTKSDVWSYGVLLMEIFTYGHSPYPGIPPKDVLKILKSGYRMKKPKDLPEEVYDVMLKCWKENPNNRPDFEFLTDFFRNILDSE